jgi:hypothetical protein
VSCLAGMCLPQCVVNPVGSAVASSMTKPPPCRSNWKVIRSTGWRTRRKCGKEPVKPARRSSGTTRRLRAASISLRGSVLMPNAKLTDDEERGKDARIGTGTCPRSSSFGQASCWLIILRSQLYQPVTIRIEGQLMYGPQ